MSDPRPERPGAAPEPQRHPAPAPELTGGELLGTGLMLAAAFLAPMAVGLAAMPHVGAVGIVLGLLLGIVAAVLVVYVRFGKYFR